MKMPDPFEYPSFVDNHFFDKLPDVESRAAGDLIEWSRGGLIQLVIPYSVLDELDHPNTPWAVRLKATSLIHTLPCSVGSQERLALAKRIMRGNGLSDQHDGDATHLWNAAAWNAKFFVTMDRGPHKKADSLRSELDIWVVHPSSLMRLIEERRVCWLT